MVSNFTVQFFDFWTDGYTVAAILYVQESYDTYDWDAEVNVKGVNKHYLNVAPDGSWTLRKLHGWNHSLLF